MVKLKNDLNSGEDGFPRYVVVGGDQQTYVHMSNLKLKYPGCFNWVYPVPGDWHIMKNCWSIILNGGFACFVRKCGHKSEVTQWQDIHQVLTAMYEAITKLQYCKSNNINTQFLNDQLSCFWSKILVYLHAYAGFYFAVRSGNCFLRNSCLKVFSELYFAYARNKYEVLCISAFIPHRTNPSLCTW